LIDSRRTTGSRKGIPLAKKELFRGSWDLPLAQEGVEDAIRVGEATKGVWDTIYHSNLGRTTRTAKCVQQFSPDAELIPTSKLRPMHLGAIEGKEVNTERIRDMNEILRDTPSKPLPGISSKSDEPGESLNSFRFRVLKFLKKVEDELKPNERILLVTHYRDIQLVKSYLSLAEPPDFGIDVEMLLKKGSQKPGDLFWFDLENRSLNASDDAKKKGLYLMRHGKTAANA
jgi:broad specificity phosphatase PhoE